MNNEPVAFVSKEDLKKMKTHLCYLHLKPQKNDIPLYIHPAKTLTDEEITNLFRASSDHIEFARAILIKAQQNE
jgi:hypothetical protein